MGRVISLENELCMQCIPKGPVKRNAQLGSSKAAPEVFEALGLQKDAKGGYDSWMKNGSRIYIDRSGLEVANAECSTPEELVALDNANMHWLAERASAITQLNDTSVSIRFYKSNTDGVRTTGTHENYQIFRQPLSALSLNAPLLLPEQANAGLLDYIGERLIPFLITRIIYAGGGGIDGFSNTATMYGMMPRYVLSTRALYLKNLFTYTTTQERGIINTRDEPHADQKRFMRLHLICGDANMSELATYLKTGVTSILLSMIEQGSRLPSLLLRHPIRDLYRVNHDLTGKRRKVELEDGRTFSALEVQLAYCDAMEHHLVQHPDPVHQRVFSVYRDVLGKIEHQDLLGMHQYFDHALKYKLLHDLVLQHGKGFNNTDARTITLLYHWTDAAGLFNKLSFRFGHKRIITDQEIEHYKTNAPQTRAAGRTRLVSGLQDRGFRILQHWERVSFRPTEHLPHEFYGHRIVPDPSLRQEASHTDAYLYMPDPGHTYVNEAQELLEKLDTYEEFR